MCVYIFLENVHFSKELQKLSSRGPKVGQAGEASKQYFAHMIRHTACKSTKRSNINWINTDDMLQKRAKNARSVLNTIPSRGARLKMAMTMMGRGYPKEMRKNSLGIHKGIGRTQLLRG
jgi:hypothetical protein